MAPSVSILMPVYRAETTLAAAVDSVRRQTREDWELWLCDDASPDRCGALCEEFAAADGRIRVIHIPENHGPGPARNAALKEATGDYILMMDSDDVIDEDLLERALTALEEYGVQTAVFGMTEEFLAPDGTVTAKNPVTFPFTVCRTVDEVRETLIRLEARTLFGYNTNKLYRREVLIENGILSPGEPLYEDFFLNAAYAPHITSMVVLDTAPYHYLKRGSGLTAQFVPRYFPLSRRRVATVWEMYQNWDMATEEVRRLLGGIYTRYIFSALQRNCDPRMGLTRRERKAFLTGLYADPLFSDTVPYAAPEGRQMRLLHRLLNRRRTGLCLLAGRGLYVIKTRLPALFRRASHT